jgi:hypothetical protein
MNSRKLAEPAAAGWIHAWWAGVRGIVGGGS